ncbi:MAG: DUF456 domain-containing protein [Gammaproteobacteria bacterium]|nr:DUF456 domain-containing protein [Gammaproteobacteria bacterium]
MSLLWLSYIAAGLLIAIGLAGVVLPVIPGIPLMFAGMWLLAWAQDFVHVGPVTLWILAVLTLLSVAVDLLASVLGARRVGASRGGLVGAAIGTVIGLFFGLPGILFGPLVGAVAGELMYRPGLHSATRVGLATWAGIIVGAVFKVAIAFVMLGLFAFALVF